MKTMHTIRPEPAANYKLKYVDSRNCTGRWQVGFVVVSPGSWGNGDNSFWHNSVTCDTQGEAVELCRKLNGQ